MDIIFDLDGTLSDCEWRRYLVLGPHKDFDTFNRLGKDDAPIHQVAMIARGLAANGMNRIIITTGRPDTFEDETRGWLLKHNIPNHLLLMRPAGNTIADEELKLEFLFKLRSAGFTPELAFDDRDKVVKMWRDNGLVCCQVAPGSF